MRYQLVSDANNSIRVKLDFSGVENANKIKDTTVIKEVNAAQETVDRESPIIEKLKKFHGSIKAIQAIGAAVKDVSVLIL